MDNRAIDLRRKGWGRSLTVDRAALATISIPEDIGSSALVVMKGGGPVVGES